MLQRLQAAGADTLENIRHRAPAHLGVRLCEGRGLSRGRILRETDCHGAIVSDAPAILLPPTRAGGSRQFLWLPPYLSSPSDLVIINYKQPNETQARSKKALMNFQDPDTKPQTPVFGLEPLDETVGSGLVRRR